MIFSLGKSYLVSYQPYVSIAYISGCFYPSVRITCARRGYIKGLARLKQRELMAKDFSPIFLLDYKMALDVANVV